MGPTVCDREIRRRLRPSQSSLQCVQCLLIHFVLRLYIKIKCISRFRFMRVTLLLSRIDCAIYPFRYFI